jgi:DNA-binding response OmpR family regulator
LLLLLVRAAGDVLSRDDLAQGALGRSLAPFDRSIDNHISGLRRKLGNKLGGVERIRSVRGNGYVYSNQSRNERDDS